MDLPFHNKTFAYNIISHLNQPNHFDSGSQILNRMKKANMQYGNKSLATHLLRYINFVTVHRYLVTYKLIRSPSLRVAIHDLILVGDVPGFSIVFINKAV